MRIKKIGVVGGGIMGSGIAQVASSAGYDVVLNDMEDRFLDRAFTSISDSLERTVKKEKITPGDKISIIARINRSTSLDDFSDVDLVVEAVNEDKTLKQDIFRRLDSICRKEVILASNTSSISITT